MFATIPFYFVCRFQREKFYQEFLRIYNDINKRRLIKILDELLPIGARYMRCEIADMLAER